jgi:fumarylpyruvate hydrolase
VRWCNRAHSFPPATENLHHEVELVVVLKTGGTDIDDDALSRVYGCAVGNDLTRDIQTAVKSSLLGT